MAVVLLSPIRYWWFGWYGDLDEPFKLIFDLVWIGIIALVAAALIAPLEALGWWAGWYGDRGSSMSNPPKTPADWEQTQPTSEPDVSCYLVYLDGISQSKFEFTPDIQDFFTALEPALPQDVKLIKEIMVYSVRDKPLTTANRPLSFLWRIAQGVLFEVHHTPEKHKHLVGQVVMLRFGYEPETQSYVRAVTKDVHFSPQAEYSVRQGNVHPTRIDGWRLVNPLESLAGSHPVDDMMVMLQEPVIVRSKDKDSDTASNKAYNDDVALYISHEPVQITGRYYALVKFRSPISDSDLFRVVHFNRASGQFDGIEETVRMPPVVPNRNNTCPSTTKNIEQSYLNETGWYIYGAEDESREFIVRALAPRRLLQVEPERIITGAKSVKKYLKKEAWNNLPAKKGKIDSVLLNHITNAKNNPWVEGKRALLIHTYGGIGGNKTEPAAKTPLYFGHFAYGIATIVREPLTDELRFEIVYHQVYTQNSEGLIAGSLHWSRYMGDRNWGWLGLRPVCDIIIELDEFTGVYETNRGPHSPLNRVVHQLEVMAARYRIGDGTGGTFVEPAYNCVQDANQALYAALRQISRSIRSNPNVEEWKQEHPEQLYRLERLEQLTEDFKHLLLPWGTARADWEDREEVLGSTLEDDPVQNLIRGLITWRTLLPRLTSDEVVQAFLKQGGQAWVLRTNQVGGVNPDIELVAPMTL